MMFSGSTAPAQLCPQTRRSPEFRRTARDGRSSRLARTTPRLVGGPGIRFRASASRAHRLLPAQPNSAAGLAVGPSGDHRARPNSIRLSARRRVGAQSGSLLACGRQLRRLQPRGFAVGRPPLMPAVAFKRVTHVRTRWSRRYFWPRPFPCSYVGYPVCHRRDVDAGYPRASPGQQAAASQSVGHTDGQTRSSPPPSAQTHESSQSDDLASCCSSPRQSAPRRRAPVVSIS
jgi:hypothetical protein